MHQFVLYDFVLGKAILCTVVIGNKFQTQILRLIEHNDRNIEICFAAATPFSNIFALNLNHRIIRLRYCYRPSKLTLSKKTISNKTPTG